MSRALPSSGDVIAAFARKERTASSRSFYAGVVFFLLPLFVMIVIGFAMRGYTTPALHLGIVGSAASPDARVLVQELESNAQLQIRAYDREEPMRIAVHRGRLHGGLVLPTGYRAVDEPGMFVSEAGGGGGALRASVERAIARVANPQAPRASLEVLGGGGLGRPPVGFQYTAPSNLVLFIAMNAILSSVTLVGLRRSELGRRLRATPATPAQLLGGLLVGPLQLMTAQAVFLIAVGALAFGVSWGDPTGLVLLTSALVACGVTGTVFLGTLFRSENQVVSFGPFLGIVLGMLGGCMWPLEIVPPALRSFGHLFPTAWAMDGYLALGFDDAGTADVLPHVAVLLAMAVGLGLTAWLRLRARPV